MKESPLAAELEPFIANWSDRDGGQELANYVSFLNELCDLLGVGRPHPASHITDKNAYVFERAVTFRTPDGGTSPGRIDLYKRGAFVLEAKQSRSPVRPRRSLSRAISSPRKSRSLCRAAAARRRVPGTC